MLAKARFRCDVCDRHFDYGILNALITEFPIELGPCKAEELPGIPCVGELTLEWAFYELIPGEEFPAYKLEFANGERTASITTGDEQVDLQSMP